MTMRSGILLYDQLFVRPLVALADKFRFEESSSATAQSSWLLTWLKRTSWLEQFTKLSGTLLERSFVLFRRKYDGTSVRSQPQVTSAKAERIWDAIIAAAAFYALWLLIHYVHT